MKRSNQRRGDLLCKNNEKNQNESHVPGVAINMLVCSSRTDNANYTNTLTVKRTSHRPVTLAIGYPLKRARRTPGSLTFLGLTATTESMLVRKQGGNAQNASALQLQPCTVCHEDWCTWNQNWHFRAVGEILTWGVDVAVFSVWSTHSLSNLHTWNCRWRGNKEKWIKPTQQTDKCPFGLVLPKEI